LNPGFYLRTLARESRGARGRLTFFALCLATGVAAVVAVAGLGNGLAGGVRSQARQLLAADVTVEGLHAVPKPVLEAAGRRVETGELLELVTVVSVPPAVAGDLAEAISAVPQAPPHGSAGDLAEAISAVPQAPPHGSAGDLAEAISDGADGRRQPDLANEPGHSRLVELKVVTGRYPFYGTLVLSPERTLSELLTAETCVVAPDLLHRLEVPRDGTISIGGARFRIGGVIVAEPDRIAGALSIGPRVFLSREGYARTGLGGFGSRVVHRVLFKLPEGAGPEAAQALAERLKKATGDSSAYRVQTYVDARPELRQGIRRVERFLSLVALLSLLIGGVGVSQSVRAWIASRLDAIAVLRCLGMRPREVFGLYLGQTGLLALAGSLAGAAAGLLLLVLVPRLYAGFLPQGWVTPWQPMAVLRGLGMGVGVALLFSLPPLASVRRVPPARVLRRDAEPLPPSRATLLFAGLLLAGGLVGFAALQARSLRIGGLFAAGLLAAAAVLGLSAFGLSKALGRVPRLSVAWPLRSGLSNTGRPGTGVIGSIVALGLGVLVVLALQLVHTHLADQLVADLPQGAPTAFFLDVQPDQWPGVLEVLRSEGASGVDSVPVVMARLSAINGKDVEVIAARQSGQRSENRRWALTREQRLTYLDKLPRDNKVVEGKLWADPRPEVSLEAEFAKNLGAKVGSMLTFDLQGVPLTLLVSSLRTVDWRTFGINFFFVVEPGVLEDAPQNRLAAARLPKAKEQRIQDLLAQRYPNITVIVIREVLERVVKVVQRMGIAVRTLGGFAVLTGIVILAGAVSAGTVRRGRDAALLKTLGVTRAGVAAVFAVEYALIGLVAGALGTLGGYAIAWLVVTEGFEMPWRSPLLPGAVSVAGAVALTVLAGLGASARALRRRPLEALREE